MRRPALTTLALSLCTANCGIHVHAQALDLLQVTSSGSTQRFVVAGASFGGALPRVTDATDTTTPLRLVQATIIDDCQHIKPDAQVNSVTAVVVERGGACSFVQKALAVQTAGAALLVVGDSIQGAYAGSRQSGQAIYDCSAGRGYVARNATTVAMYPEVDEPQDGLASCTDSDACVTSTCVYTGASRRFGSNFEVCCFSNTLIRMGADSKSALLASGVTIPAVFVSYRDTLQLQKLLALDADLELRAFNAEENPWNVSMLLTWLLGVMIVVGGAYCSATDERRYSYEKVAMGSVPLSSDSMETQYVSIDDRDPRAAHQASSDANDGYASEENSDRVQLSTKHALYFVVGSSLILVLLYYGHLAMLMNVLFLIATTASMTQVVIFPVLASLLPLHFVAATKRELVLSITSVSLAAIITTFWFLHRSNTNIWPLQDLLCISLCFVVIDSIQLPSLKVATALLGVAFCYDIFFVYISPLIFGSSVMVDVASGGGGGGSSGIHAAASATVHEKLPIVLSIPLLFSYYGGSALLGLGDLILPGLLVSFCIRYDYCMGYPLSRNYFAVASVSYAAGLLLANIMAIALRDVVAGQPALMYIVPLTLGSVMLLAASKYELDELWEGPQCLRMENALSLGLKAEEPLRRDEVEPFLKKQ